MTNSEHEELKEQIERLRGMLTESMAATKSAEERADALAVENAALKSSIDLIASAYTEGEPAGFEIDGARHIETPATDAALAAIHAQGVEKFAGMCREKSKLATTADSCAGWSNCSVHASSFAVRLREAK